MQAELSTRIQRLFRLLTIGCGNPRCTNPNCASNPAVGPASPNDAAARAMSLAVAQPDGSASADVCPPRTPTPPPRPPPPPVTLDTIADALKSGVVPEDLTTQVFQVFASGEALAHSHLRPRSDDGDGDIGLDWNATSAT